MSVTPEPLAAALDRTVTMVRDMMAVVHPLEIGMRAVAFKDGQEMLLTLPPGGLERSWAVLGKAASAERWDCCVLIYEVAIGEPPAPGQVDTREDAVLFYAEGRRGPPIMRRFALSIMPDDTLRLGAEHPMGADNYFERLGRVFRP